MEHIQIYESELRLMELIWDRAPVRSTVLAQMAGEILGWKKIHGVYGYQKISRAGNPAQ